MDPLAKSPLAPERSCALSPLRGVTVSTARTGMKYQDRDDLLLMRFDEGTSAAGVFTTSSTAAAPVHWCRKALESNGMARALLVNAGNANAFTGAPGDAVVKESVKAVSEALDCKEDEIYVSSTGVIGEIPAIEKITSHVPALCESEANDWMAAADAIRTTDTFVKTATRQVLLGETMVSINGIAKGSGMVEPNMATMLAYVVTDAAVAPEALQAILSQCNDVTFNAITVDSDTSTNDTVLAFATGGSESMAVMSAEDPLATAFVTAFQEVMLELAHQVVRDGEGASKFVTICVNGAQTDASAMVMAKAIANSPLVKTAIAGEDANWGRIVMAIGKSGEPIELEQIGISIGGYDVARDGGAIVGYDETPVAAHMKGSDIDITVHVGSGSGKAIAWTCDLTHGYISINADYRS